MHVYLSRISRHNWSCSIAYEIEVDMYIALGNKQKCYLTECWRFCLQSSPSFGDRKVCPTYNTAFIQKITYMVKIATTFLGIKLSFMFSSQPICEAHKGWASRFSGCSILSVQKTFKEKITIKHLQRQWDRIIKIVAHIAHK